MSGTITLETVDGKRIERYVGDVSRGPCRCEVCRDFLGPMDGGCPGEPPAEFRGLPATSPDIYCDAPPWPEKSEWAIEFPPDVLGVIKSFPVKLKRMKFFVGKLEDS